MAWFLQIKKTLSAFAVIKNKITQDVPCHVPAAAMQDVPRHVPAAATSPDPASSPIADHPAIAETAPVPDAAWTPITVFRRHSIFMPDKAPMLLEFAKNANCISVPSLNNKDKKFFCVPAFGPVGMIQHRDTLGTE
jgi:transcriptional regulator of nitric oxide reductase